MSNKTSFAGFEITTSKNGRPMRPSLVKMLRAVGAEAKISARLRSSFDGMTDGMQPCDVPVSLEALAAFVAKGGPTFGAYFSRGVLNVYSASYDYEVIDIAEDLRRAAAIATLPEITSETGPLWNGFRVVYPVEVATRERAQHLYNKSGIDFDDAIEALRAHGMRDAAAICAFLHVRLPSSAATDASLDAATAEIEALVVPVFAPASLSLADRILALAA